MLEVKGLVKTFGEMTAVDQLSFTIPKGTILGLIGQNGAGKTTTFRLILNFLKANQGQVLWDGQPLTEKDYDMIGYLPEERGLYPKISIEEQLIYFARLRGKSKREIEPKIDEWMEKFQVKGKRTDKVKSLSKGNQQKVQLIATLIHEPKLIILDEPFSGLDPVNAELLKNGIIELKDKGACVIFSSHNMENVEKICDHLIMLRNGQTVLDGEVHTIRQSFGRTKLMIDSSLPLETIQAIDGVLSTKQRPDGMLEVNLRGEEVGKDIFKQAAAYGYMPVFNQFPPTLEDIFKMKVGEGNE
ncbi:ABC transporter ATP-binding protein [Vagococcus xieshaowenii]|uniref:ABC transporter ATP-binding protein n=1 Tax=Vagococcus xieshaowenii TaxID=2562451 RepID=A0AAJ5EEB7_9ENTE|nr:ABC transporter ATP-binding protein [Vagococcus xieshaowenii]QCA27968.1 ABC transporter ATP-binding protein [Vagococcus xieshaowenii]TFZ41265.1 ABC transporter ATP-binding protein [Vagococcus xieshaowenii]